MFLCNHKQKMKYHRILQNKNMKAAPDKSHFFLNTRKISWTHYREKHYKPIEITNRCNSKTPQATYKQKENPRIFWNVKFLLKKRL